MRLWLGSNIASPARLRAATMEDIEAAIKKAAEGPRLVLRLRAAQSRHWQLAGPMKGVLGFTDHEACQGIGSFGDWMVCKGSPQEAGSHQEGPSILRHISGWDFWKGCTGGVDGLCHLPVFLHFCRRLKIRILPLEA